MAHPQHESVRRAFEYRCGYCGVEESATGSELTVDHYRPRSQGGGDEIENLVYACAKCNQYKGDYWPSNEEETVGQYVLHPHRDDLSLHLREDPMTGEIRPLTPTGEFHIRLLHLNRPPLIASRLARQTADLLRQRVRLLEEQIQQREQTLELLNQYITLLVRLVSLAPPEE
ncbi:MAG: HNH endonuclease signature motif containing protein [Acidobacteriota bacterium]